MTTEDRIKLNPCKSGIMRLISRKGKWLIINYALDIPEVEIFRNQTGSNFETRWIIRRIKKKRKLYSEKGKNTEAIVGE